MVLAIIVSEYPTFTHSFELVYIFVSTFFLGKLVWTGRLCSRMLIKISHLSAKSHFSPLANIDKRKIPLTNELLRFAPVFTLIFFFGGGGRPWLRSLKPIVTLAAGVNYLLQLIMLKPNSYWLTENQIFPTTS